MGKIDMGFIKLSYECSDLIEEIKGDISEFGEKMTIGKLLELCEQQNSIF